MALLSVVMLGASAMFGYGYTLFCGNHIGDGRKCDFSVNPNSLDAPTPDQEEAAIVNAGAEWTNNSLANFRYNYLGRTTRNTVSPSDQRQDIFWRNESSGSALAVTVCNGSSVSSGADILFYDSGWTWQIGGSLDIQTVALHEMGHMLGLGHTNVGGSVMLPNYHGIDRDLGADDKNGAQSIYGTVSSAPDLTNVSPASGPVRGGDQVTLTGTNFRDDATATFDGASASIVSRTGSTQIVVTAPPGTFAGQTADVRVSQTGGTDTMANAYTYTENPVELTWTGNPRVGQTITFTVFGPANKRVGLIAGNPGETVKGPYTFCAEAPFVLRKFPTQLNTGADGQVSVDLVVSGDVFQTFNAQGIVGGVVTNCTSYTVFP